MEHYLKARREGLRVYAAAIQANTDPYLPVLEERVSGLSQLSRLSLGVQTIPLDRVAGSVSRGRSYAFASNFMPILESGSEFSGKWDHVYEGIEEEGQLQPVKVLEYYGYYYVIEGNKRVSVLKAMASDEIEADVTRVWPEKADTPEYAAYEAYCAFTKETGLYGLLFTRPGSYAKLVSLPGVRAGETWTQEEIRNLRSCWSEFHAEYLRLTRGRSVLQAGDAFLALLTAFGYLTVRDEGISRIAEHIRLMAREFETREGDVRLVMDPAPEQAPAVPLLSSLFRPSKIRAAFLFNRPPEESAWNYWHNLGRLELEEKLAGKVETAVRIIPSRGDFAGEVSGLMKEGYTAFFATSPVMLNSCVEPALEHPEASFLCCSLLSSYRNIRSYYIRFYEAKFLLGLAAGILSGSGKIGYVADFPIYGVASGINAFALGARMTRPQARIFLNWTSAGFFDPDCPFEDPEIDVICNRDLTAPGRETRDNGLYLRRGGEVSSVAALVPRWGPFYVDVVSRLLKGTLKAGDRGENATNYWWGLNSRILDIAFSSRFDPSVRRLISRFRADIADGSFFPFEGELRDQSGVLRCGADQRLSPAEILCMDYLADNIVGSFPSLEELIPSARPLVRLQGIGGEQRPELSSFSWNRK